MHGDKGAQVRPASNKLAKAYPVAERKTPLRHIYITAQKEL